MLYNLMESTVRTAIDEIFDRVRREGNSYVQVREELRTLWIRDGLFDLERSGGGKETYRQLARALVEKAVQNLTIEFDVGKLPISGNIDAREIRKLAKLFGFSEKIQTTHASNSGPRLRGRIEYVRDALLGVS